MYYDKRIRYIDYLENGEKRYNCGYVKMIVTGGSLLMEMQIKGLYETDDVASEITLEGAGTECRIGTVVIRQGSGSFRGEFRDPLHEGEKMVIDGEITYGQLMRIAVQLSPRRSLLCIWREARQAKTAMAVTEEQLASTGEAAVLEEQSERAAGAEMPEEQPERAAGTVISEKQQERATGAAMLEEQSESVAGAAVSEKQPESAAGAEMPEEQPESAAEAVIPEELAESVVEEKAEMDVTTKMQEEGVGPQEELHTAETQRQSIPEPAAAVLCEDKWQQLQMIYPHIYPFQDERGYLSLRPEDFVILSSNAYRLVRNSFLLHGYYNYEHLILTNVTSKSASQYYIGVPGNFYEKEKQVAIMYGFNSFECKREPAEEGDFGYYMIRVEL